MKYYAVTDDPNELMHYGVKGMKWGQHIFGKERSTAFKKAATKLRASMKSGIKKTNANLHKASVNRAAKKEAKKNFKEAQFNAKAQARLDEALGNQANKAARKEQAAVRREIRRENAAERREDRKMERYLQKARQGTLKYKKLSDNQIDTIANRLNLENQARRLSGNETPHFLTRIKRSIGEGVVRGVGSAVAVGIEENARARARYKAEQKYGAKTAKAKLKNQQKTAKREARAEADKEFYEMQAQNGERSTFYQTVGPNARKNRMRQLSDYKAKKKENERQNALIENAMRRDKGENTNDYLDRIMKNDWREKIGYQGYAPDPKARVRLTDTVKKTAKTLATTPHRSQFFVSAPPQTTQSTDSYDVINAPTARLKIKRRGTRRASTMQVRTDLFNS